MKKNDIVISPIDKRHFEIIRNNVTSFVKKCAQKYDDNGKTLLDIAPQDYLGAKEFFTKCKIKTLDIDKTSKCDYIADICKNNKKIIPNSHFDYVLCTEVIEHIHDPFAGAKELYRILKKDGLLFVSLPFNFRIHGPLPDYWRFTEHGIRALFKNFKQVKIESIKTESRDLMPIHYTITIKK